MACGMLLLLGSITPEVMAIASDDSAAVAAPERSVPWAMVVAAAVVLIVLLRTRWYRLDHAPDRPTRSHAATGLLLFLLTLFTGAVAVAITVSALNLVPTPQALEEPLVSRDVLGRTGMLLGQGVVLVLAAMIWFGPRTRFIIAWPAAVVLGVVAMVVWWPLVATAAVAGSLLEQAITGSVPDVIAHDTLRTLLESPRDVWFWAMIVLAVPVAAVVEEAIYRGLLQTSLAQLFGRTNRGRWAAIIVTSIVFTMAHAGVTDIAGLCALGVLSVGFGWALERSGRLLVPIIMHATFNAANLLLAFALAT